jgi:hypothetical protein
MAATAELTTACDSRWALAPFRGDPVNPVTLQFPQHDATSHLDNLSVNRLILGGKREGGALERIQ